MKQPTSPLTSLDLRKLKTADLGQLEEISASIRELIIQTVKVKSGHYAAPLGVVDLTVALHYVFDSPFDRIVWDTGHQAYAHKILTGRADGFNRLRTREGISGFPLINESPHDAFGSGHASTAIAAAA